MRRGAQEQRLEDGKISFLVWKKFGDENCLRTNMTQGPTVKKCKSRSSPMSQKSLSPHIYSDLLLPFVHFFLYIYELLPNSFT